MTHRLLFGILLVSASTTYVLTVTAAPSMPSDTAQSLEVIRKKHDLPALAVVVVKDGRICDRAAVGVRKWGETTPVTTNDVFHIGSCTKSMTATLTAMLIEDGKLRWDTTIADVFPELKGKMDKQYESVTVEQLLTHRGGVPGAPPAAAWKRAWEQKGTPTQQRREFIEAVLAPAAGSRAWHEEDLFKPGLCRHRRHARTTYWHTLGSPDHRPALQTVTHGLCRVRAAGDNRCGGPALGSYPQTARHRAVAGGQPARHRPRRPCPLFAGRPCPVHHVSHATRSSRIDC